MNQQRITTNDLTPGDTIVITGKLFFSHLVKPVDVEEENKRRMEAFAQGRTKRMFNIDRPYYDITLTDAKIKTNGQKPTLAQEYMADRMYTSKSEHAVGKNITLRNYVQPIVCEVKDHQATQVILERELAEGLDVTLIAQVYRTSMNNGIAVRQVLVQAPIRYYDPAKTANTLEELGLTFIPAASQPASTESTDVTDTTPSVSTTDQPDPTVSTNAAQTANSLDNGTLSDDVYF